MFFNQDKCHNLQDSLCQRSELQKVILLYYDYLWNSSTKFTLISFSITLLKVKCDMSPNPPRTIIEHNYPRKTEVKNAGDSKTNGNTYNIEYIDINKDQLIALIQRQTCSQSLR